MNLETSIPVELWQAIKVNYEKSEFTGAILDAFYFLSELIRKKSGAEGDGATLIGQAFGGKLPKIKLNMLQSESEISIQKGVETTLRGLYQAIRNPRSHEKLSDTQEDAQSIIVFIGYMIKVVDKAKSKFSRPDFLRMVLDPNFVPKPRYAKILLDDVPSRHRFDVFLDIYRAKEDGKPDNLNIFFTELFSIFTVSELKQACDFISDELMRTDSDMTIRHTLGVLNNDIWPNIGEAARLRIENRLCRSIYEGRYNSVNKTCNGGSLATWSRRYLSSFTLKHEVILAASDSLWSGVKEREDYIFQYILRSLILVSDVMPKSIDQAFRLKIKKGNPRFHSALLFDCPWERSTWSPELLLLYDNFVAAEEPTEDFDDDIPF